MSGAALLIEIGCEEIPARMIQRASMEFEKRVIEILDQAGLNHGKANRWAGPRRLAVRIDGVEARQSDRDEQLTGPSAEVAFDADGKPTRAAIGFAKKLGIGPGELQVIETERGRYVGLQRTVPGKPVGTLLREELPARIAQMSFPKTMRWADGVHRWVRPVHWILALHGSELIDLEVFGVRSGRESAGHRFLHEGKVSVAAAEEYEATLDAAHVVVQPERRRELLAESLRRSAEQAGGRLVEDNGLLDEVADLVEWPGIAEGRFDRKFLELPRELLVTTLRFHQKCFSVQGEGDELLPVFFAVANTDRDPAGHVRRGNEWVVGGRLDDAAFFWAEDRKKSLDDRAAELSGVGLHPKLGSYAEKAERMKTLSGGIAEHLGLAPAAVAECRQAAALAKVDLVTGTVGEFPELQGKVGGLLLEAEGRSPSLARAVYEHYLPSGPSDPVPSVVEGAIVSLADRLDALSGFIGIGEAPTGSRDPFGLRRASNGLFRIVLEHELALSLGDLGRLCSGGAQTVGFLKERMIRFLRDAGYSSNEIAAVIRPRVDDSEVEAWKIPAVRARLEAISRVRGRDDFRKLVELTERVQNILLANGERVEELVESIRGEFDETEATARDLNERIEKCEPLLVQSSESQDYGRIVEILSEFIEPVDAFFNDVLVINENDAEATVSRYRLLVRLRTILTRYFDIRELAGEADRRA